MDEMGRRWRIKLQHANRERERAEIEVQESRKAMGEMRERTDQAVAAHEAAAAKAAAERDAAESKAQQLALDLEWKTYAAEQVEEVMRGQEKRLGDAETLNRSLLLRCKGVEGLATELQKELTQEKAELSRLVRRQATQESEGQGAVELNGYLKGRLDSARRREQQVEEDMGALRTAVEAAGSVQATLGQELHEAQAEQATLSTQLMRVSQDRDRLAEAVSTAHINYKKQIAALRSRLRGYESEGAQSKSRAEAPSGDEHVWTCQATKPGDTGGAREQLEELLQVSMQELTAARQREEDARGVVEGLGQEQSGATEGKDADGQTAISAEQQRRIDAERELELAHEARLAAERKVAELEKQLAALLAAEPVVCGASNLHTAMACTLCGVRRPDALLTTIAPEPKIVTLRIQSIG